MGRQVDIRKAFRLGKATIITLPQDTFKPGDYVELRRINSVFILKKVNLEV